MVLILLVWEDTPWNSAAIRGHHYMSTVIQIPAGYIRFVSAHKQSDEATVVLSPLKWPVEFVLIANAKNRETFICQDRIHKILGPVIKANCRLTPAQTHIFPTPPSTRGRFGGRLTPFPRRPLPIRPATPHRCLRPARLHRHAGYLPATISRKNQPRY